MGSTLPPFFSYKKGILCCESIPLSEIAQSVGTPTYVYSTEALLQPLRELQSGLKGIDHLVCFAVKSNSNIAILNLLHQAGAGMDIVSGGELYRAKAAQVPSKKIIFSGVGKTQAEMRDALLSNILSFNIESDAELSALNQVALELNTHAHVALRYNPDVNPKTHPYISTGLKENKFGLDKNEIRSILDRMDSLKGIKLCGLSIHIGSQLVSLAPLEEAFTKLSSLITEVEKRFPHQLQWIDLGGGLAIRYHSEKPPSVQRYCQLIQKYFGPRSSLKRPMKIIIEPGRSLSGQAGILLSRVLYRKPRKKKDFLIVDAGMNDLLRPALYESYHEIVPIDQSLNRGRKKFTDVVGPVCESSDCFASNRPLHPQLDSGDLIALLSAGAYGFSMASNYNSRGRPAEVWIQNHQWKVIREREKFEDLVRLEKLC